MFQRRCHYQRKTTSSSKLSQNSFISTISLAQRSQINTQLIPITLRNKHWALMFSIKMFIHFHSFLNICIILLNSTIQQHLIIIVFIQHGHWGVGIKWTPAWVVVEVVRAYRPRRHVVGRFRLRGFTFGRGIQWTRSVTGDIGAPGPATRLVHNIIGSVVYYLPRVSGPCCVVWFVVDTLSVTVTCCYWASLSHILFFLLLLLQETLDLLRSCQFPPLYVGRRGWGAQSVAAVTPNTTLVKWVGYLPVSTFGPGAFYVLVGSQRKCDQVRMKPAQPTNAPHAEEAYNQFPHCTRWVW